MSGLLAGNLPANKFFTAAYCGLILNLWPFQVVFLACMLGSRMII
jgi:hypothetical protein